MFVGILLAAGRGRRIGTLKQLLPFGQSTVVETAVQQLLNSPLDKVIVVVSAEGDSDRVIANLKDYPVEIVINPEPDSEMFDSICCALRVLPESAEAFIIALGDQPMMEPSVIQRLVDSYRQTRHGIVIPTFKGRRGHPVLIDCKYLQEILHLDGKQGIRPVVYGHLEDTLEVPVDTDSILRDIDTWEDYQRERERVKEVKR